MNTSADKLRVFDIQRLCVNDGPGIRSTVFLKGCYLKCLWCHNPESILYDFEIIHLDKLCSKCGSCKAVCPHNAVDNRFMTDAEKCVCCGKCAKVCVNGARKLCGEDIEIESILHIVTKDRAYYEESGGGVTLSGGEPMFQYAGTKALFLRLKEEGVSTALDTTGFADQDKFMDVCRYADIVLFDLKHMDHADHKRITGVDNTLIHDNLRKIAAAGKNIIVRYPMIKGLNDGEENIRQMCLFLKEIGLQTLDVIPYHDIGVNKYSSLGRQAYRIDAYTDGEIEEKLSCIRSFGIVPGVI